MVFQTPVSTAVMARVPRSRMRNPLDMGVVMTALFAAAETATSYGRAPAGSETGVTLSFTRLISESDHAWQFATAATVAEASMPLGPKPTGIVCVAARALVSITETVPPAPFVTSKFAPEKTTWLG